MQASQCFFLFFSFLCFSDPRHCCFFISSPPFLTLRTGFRHAGLFHAGLLHTTHGKPHQAKSTMSQKTAKTLQSVIPVFVQFFRWCCAVVSESFPCHHRVTICHLLRPFADKKTQQGDVRPAVSGYFPQLCGECYSAFASSAGASATSATSSAFAAFFPARRVVFFVAFLVSLSIFSL